VQTAEWACVVGFETLPRCTCMCVDPPCVSATQHHRLYGPCLSSGTRARGGRRKQRPCALPRLGRQPLPAHLARPLFSGRVRPLLNADMAALLRWFKPASALPSAALLLRFASKRHWPLPTSRPQESRPLRSALIASITAAGVSGLGAACEVGALSRADALFDANEYAQLTDLLRTALSSRPDDAQLLWRLARALKKMADAQSDKPAKEKLAREAHAAAERSLALSPESGATHKWYAITLSELGAFLGTGEKIKNSFAVREHFDRAAELSPEDATSRHLLGVWCFEVAKLSWFEQKAAAAIFASPPRSTFEEALTHFELAEKTEPDFYPKNKLLMAQAHARLGRKEEAQHWLQSCLRSTPKTPEDEQTLAEAARMQL
jgi:tetratricopeptide (TPR) repeat protein